MEAIDKRLERLLDESGTSRRQIALATGISPSHLTEMVKGAKSVEKLAVGPFMALCEELSTTPEFLFYGQGEEVSEAKNGKEAQLLMLFRTVPDDKKDMLLDILKAAGHSGNDVVA